MLKKIIIIPFWKFSIFNFYFFIFWHRFFKFILCLNIFFIFWKIFRFRIIIFHIFVVNVQFLYPLHQNRFYNQPYFIGSVSQINGFTEPPNINNAIDVMILPVHHRRLISDRSGVDGLFYKLSLIFVHLLQCAWKPWLTGMLVKNTNVEHFLC